MTDDKAKAGWRWGVCGTEAAKHTRARFKADTRAEDWGKHEPGAVSLVFSAGRAWPDYTIRADVTDFQVREEGEWTCVRFRRWPPASRAP